MQCMLNIILSHIIFPPKNSEDRRHFCSSQYLKLKLLLQTVICNALIVPQNFLTVFHVLCYGSVWESLHVSLSKYGYLPVQHYKFNITVVSLAFTPDAFLSTDFYPKSSLRNNVLPSLWQRISKCDSVSSCVSCDLKWHLPFVPSWQIFTLALVLAWFICRS